MIIAAPFAAERRAAAFVPAAPPPAVAMSK
jgi:hypothetical protein